MRCINLKKKANLVYLFLILQPILDVITSIMVRLTNAPITIGMVVRGAFLLAVLLELLFANKSPHKRKSVVYLLLLCAFCCVYILTKPDLLNLSFLIKEVTYLFKYMYFPIVVVGLINIFNEVEIGEDKILQIFTCNILVYSILILVPEFTGTSFSSYGYAFQGSVGWFYSANEIGAIMIALFPCMFYMFVQKKKVWKTLAFLVIAVLALSLLGTKVTLIGMVLTEVIYAIYYLVHYKEDKGYAFKTCILLILVTVVIFPNIRAVGNLRQSIEHSNYVVEKEESEKAEEENLTTEEREKNLLWKKVIHVALNGRDGFAKDTSEIYEKASVKDKIFGLGFVNRPTIGDSKIEKLIEMDPLDVFFHYGILGFILYCLPLAYFIIKVIKLFLKKRLEMTFSNLTNIYIVAIVTAISILAGHVYGAPAVSIYVAVNIAVLCKYMHKLEIECKTAKE